MRIQFFALIAVILIIGIFIIGDIGTGSEKYYHYDAIVVNDVHSYGEIGGLFDVYGIIDEQGRVFKIHEGAYKKLMEVYDNNPINHTLLIHHHEGGNRHYVRYCVDNISTESGIVITNN